MGGGVTCLAVKSDVCSFSLRREAGLSLFGPGGTSSVSWGVRIQCKGEQAPSDHMPQVGLSLGSYYIPLPVLPPGKVRTPHIFISNFLW